MDSLTREPMFKSHHILLVLSRSFSTISTGHFLLCLFGLFVCLFVLQDNQKKNYFGSVDKAVGSLIRALWFNSHHSSSVLGQGILSSSPKPLREDIKLLIPLVAYL